MLSSDLPRNFAKSLLHKEITVAALLGRRTTIKIGIWNTAWRRFDGPAIPPDDARPLIAVAGVCQKAYAETILHAESGGWKIFMQDATLPVDFIETPQPFGIFLRLQSIAQLIEQQEHIGLPQPDLLSHHTGSDSLIFHVHKHRDRKRKRLKPRQVSESRMP